MKDSPNSLTSADVADRVADVLLVLAGVGSGDHSLRLTKDLPEDEPMMLLYDGINEMIASLGTEQQRNASYQTELEEKLAMIDQQREAIRELSTPIIEVWEEVLCLPIVGIMDTRRSAEITESLLEAIVSRQARCAIIDITGIQVMDTATAEHFIRMARAVRLLGAECVLTGVNPSIAVTMQTMGVELNDIVTLRSLRDALQRYLESQDGQRMMWNQRSRIARGQLTS
jgi:rsbT co-antagonist protein RsbR